jgi:hypothetical protein
MMSSDLICLSSLLSSLLSIVASLVACTLEADELAAPSLRG